MAVELTETVDDGSDRLRTDEIVVFDVVDGLIAQVAVYLQTSERAPGTLTGRTRRDTGGRMSDPSAFPTKYWHPLPDGRVQCDVCPRACKLHEGQRGVCFVRAREHDAVVLTTYGRSSGFCVDPIEKKPLNHFLPGTSVLSFGTAGCNLACRFCQNWDISKSKEIDTLSDGASPATIATAAQELGCRSIAFTYNDPTIFIEYAIDVADACRAAGIAAVAVTAGYICPEPRREMYAHIDAANVDLKGFTEEFYRHVCGGHLHDVLETLEYLVHDTDVWVETTTLLIPGKNDSDEELDAMTQLGGRSPRTRRPDALHRVSSRLQDARRRTDTAGDIDPRTWHRDRERRAARVHGQRARPRRRQHMVPRRAARSSIERDWYRLGAYGADR